jgi:hypothetical protein
MEWTKYRKDRKKDFDRSLQSERANLRNLRERVKVTEKRIHVYKEQLNTVDVKCDAALNNHQALIHTHKKVRLNAKVAEALIKRDVCHVVGLLSGMSSVTYETNNLRVAPKYWCDPWFVNLLHRIDHSAINRSEMYLCLDNLHDAHSKEEIDDGIGMFLLKVV